MQAGVLDDSIDVQEQLGVPPREVPQETLRHPPKMPLDVIRQILVMVFLKKRKGVKINIKV
jgi:hypothetical protein